MQDQIKYSGLKALSGEEQSILKTIVEKEAPKIRRFVKNSSELSVNIKTLKKESKKRFIISLRLETPNNMFNTKTKDTERGGDWDLVKAAHKAMESLESELKHTLKTDSEQWKSGGIKRLLDRFGFR